jgi:hypothetical protein
VAVSVALFPAQMLVLPRIFTLGGEITLTVAVAVSVHTPLLDTTVYVVVTEGATKITDEVKPLLQE